jgi:hypothetical protein
MLLIRYSDATGLFSYIAAKHQGVNVRTTITIPDTLFNELMSFTEAGSRTEAVQVAVETYVRRAKLEQLRALRGKLDITGTEAMDEADIREQDEQFDR